MEQEETIDYNIRKTWYNITKMYNRTANEYMASMALGMIILNIDIIEGTPSTQLGPRMGMESTSLSRTLKTMENQGLIRREPNPEDGIGVLIRLTKEGLEKRSLSREVVMQFNQAIEESISPEELESFYKVIALILKKVQEKSIFIPQKQVS